MGQNVWEGDKIVIHKQRRSAELVGSFLKISGSADIEYIKIAKQKVPDSEFIKASVEYLPFKERSFDPVCILEVVEHLPAQIQKKGIREAEHVLKNEGSLIISIPYKVNIIRTKCIHCGKITPFDGGRIYII